MTAHTKSEENSISQDRRYIIRIYRQDGKVCLKFGVADPILIYKMFDNTTLQVCIKFSVFDHLC